MFTFILAGFDITIVIPPDILASLLKVILGVAGVVVSMPVIKVPAGIASGTLELTKSPIAID